MVWVALRTYLVRSTLRCYVISLGLASYGSYLTIWSWNTSGSFVLQDHGYICRAVPFSRKKNLKGFVIIEESVSSTFTNTFLLLCNYFSLTFVWIGWLNSFSQYKLTVLTGSSKAEQDWGKAKSHISFLRTKVFSSFQNTFCVFYQNCRWNDSQICLFSIIMLIMRRWNPLLLRFSKEVIIFLSMYIIRYLIVYTISIRYKLINPLIDLDGFVFFFFW